MREKTIQVSGITLLIIFALLAIQAQFAPRVAGFFEGTIQYEVELSGPDSDLIKQSKPNTQMDMHLMKGNYIINLKGGEKPKTFLFIADSNREYIVEATKGIAYKFSKFTDRIYHEELDEEPVAKSVGKKAEVNGVICDIFLLKLPKTQFAYYVNDDYRIDLSAFPKQAHSNASFLVKGLEGRIPLKTIKRQKNLTVTTTYKEIKAQNFNPKQFLIPPNFSVLSRDYRY